MQAARKPKKDRVVYQDVLDEYSCYGFVSEAHCDDGTFPADEFGATCAESVGDIYSEGYCMKHSRRG